MNVEPKFEVVDTRILEAYTEKLKATQNAVTALWWIIFALIAFANLGISLWWTVLVAFLAFVMPPFVSAFKASPFERRHR